ncbi:MAG: hypothetical protein IH609_17220 [Dehalococcoidia bacterium]|nr:hypothetical protein [Dehalococcoidia bacterium]
MAATCRSPFGERVSDFFARAALAIGLGERDARLLTVAAGESGRPITARVTLLAGDGHEWIVPRPGDFEPAEDSRAVATATLRRGRNRREVAIRELAPDEAVPVIRRHIERLPAASEHWDVHPDDSDESILTEAAHYPVFLVE